jgi:aryl-alcohol dehydrogenase-like predicted oxidoreductase
MGVIAKRPLANVAWRYARKPSEPYYQAYWSRLRALDYPFLRGNADGAAATALRFTLSVAGVHTAIAGTTKPDRWAQNAAVLEDGPLPAEEMKQIRARWREVAKSSWVGQI